MLLPLLLRWRRICHAGLRRRRGHTLLVRCARMLGHQWRGRAIVSLASVPGLLLRRWRVVQLLRVVGRLLLRERDALLRHGSVGACLLLGHHEDVAHVSDRTAVQAGAAVAVDDDGVDDEADEIEEAGFHYIGG